ncbi:ScbA/BarX family gamma-butyrolactone biosynthesis protein [Actinophytocola sp.]|uniref:ScbA/BarX family gamma-butyrolactone biosynthesis protein n=1 Tax=Actinophytocola sp. TaxID=1872138 RepID=UPI002EDA8009
MTTMINPQPELPMELRRAERLFQQVVPPRLVRRTGESDVFVTNLRVTGYDAFEVSVQLPAAHSFYGPTGNRHDSLLLLECVRQAGLLVGHVAYEIPREFKFVTHDKQFQFDPAGLRTAGDQPVDLVMMVTQHDVKRRGRRIASMRTEVEVLRDGKRVGTATYRWSCVSGPAYAKLRSEYKDAAPLPSDATPVAPERVGRVDEVDVLLAERSEGRGWALRVSPDHSVIYDHVIDHVPGNAVVEAARQAALLAAGSPGALPVAGDLRFSHYLEFDAPCHVWAEVVGSTAGGTTGVRFVIEQSGRDAVNGVIELLVP